MLYLRIWSLKSTEMRGIEILPSSTKKLGFQPKLANRRQSRRLRSQHHTHRCTIHPPMISSKKSERKRPSNRRTRIKPKSSEKGTKTNSGIWKEIGFARGIGTRFVRWIHSEYSCHVGLQDTLRITNLGWQKAQTKNHSLLSLPLS
jgi:hypothetical protein